jgi:hypothetical protein
MDAAGVLTDCMPGQQTKSMLMDGSGRSGSCYGSEGWGSSPSERCHIPAGCGLSSAQASTK